ncbi:MAG TPA: hypothetical protein VMW01_00650 [Williamwhitmania sp.]|nr:hypothetical protein [Williamwhitmania sp.]
MKQVVKTALFVAFAMLLAFCGRDVKVKYLSDGSKELLEGTMIDGIKRVYGPEDNLTMIIPLKDSLPNGMVISYYSNGKVRNIVKAVKGVKDSTDVSFYVTGVKSNETNYFLGKKNGDQKEFYPSGKLKSVQTFKMSMSNGDLKEYTMQGELIPNAQLIVEVENKLSTWNEFVITARLYPPTKKFRLYRKYPIISETQPYTKVEVINGVGRIEIFRTQLEESRKMEIVAIYKTPFGNDCKLPKQVVLK